MSQAVQCLDGSSGSSSSNLQPAALIQAANQVRPAITLAQGQVIAHANRFTVEQNALFQRGSRRPLRKKSWPINFGAINSFVWRESNRRKHHLPQRELSAG